MRNWRFPKMREGSSQEEVQEGLLPLGCNQRVAYTLFTTHARLPAIGAVQLAVAVAAASVAEPAATKPAVAVATASVAVASAAVAEPPAAESVSATAFLAPCMCNFRSRERNRFGSFREQLAQRLHWHRVHGL